VTDLTLVVGLVHPDISDISINFLSVAKVSFGDLTSTLSTLDGDAFTVSEFHSHGAPGGAVEVSGLGVRSRAARCDLSNLTVLSDSGSFLDGSGTDVLSSNRGVETSILLSHDASSLSRHSSSRLAESLSDSSNLTHMETKEVGLSFLVISDTEKFSTSSKNFR
jgi:hypothetical protein